jgi:uncharacterized protein YndB with AHSA1/START domain
MNAREADASGDGTTVELPSDREILVRRSFDAPARIVFEALTRPEYVRRWWMPRSRGELLRCDIDFRVGGAWRCVMRTLRGVEAGFSGRYLEIEAPTRVVQTEVFDPFPDAGAVVTVELTEQGGRTTMTSRSVYPSRQVRDQVLATGMEDGMRESYRQLTEVVVALQRAA